MWKHIEDLIARKLKQFQTAFSITNKQTNAIELTGRRNIHKLSSSLLQQHQSRGLSFWLFENKTSIELQRLRIQLPLPELSGKWKITSTLWEIMNMRYQTLSSV